VTVIKSGGSVCISTSMLLNDLDPLDLVTQMWDSAFSPWKLPDRNPMPMFDLFPRLSRFKRAWDRHWSEGEDCDEGDW
jgi:hypothetical protein